MLKKLRIKFVAVNMTIVTLMLIAIFFVLYLSTSRRMEFESFRGPKPGTAPPPPMESQIIDNNPELFNEFVIIARKATLSNLIKTYLVISVPIFGVFLIISIFLANWMIKPVEENLKKQKQFISDASHELKTPLTIITTNTEMLSDEPSLSNDGKQYVSNILTTSNKMKGLVTGLLELAKSEDSLNLKIFSKVNLSEITNQSLLPFEPLFFEYGLSFLQDIEDNIFINGNEEDLSRLIEILLDNAIKYTISKGEVHVKLFKSGNTAILSVSNTGDGISPKDCELIFDRFYRANKARTGMNSYGLGLALAKQIVTNHKGKISVHSQNGINKFVCSFSL